MGELKLTAEQEFEVAAFKVRIQDMNREQAIEQLVLLFSTMIAKEAMYKQMLKEKLGIGINEI